MMSVEVSEWLGPSLVQHDSPSSIPSSVVKGKSVALYFSAHWCPPSRDFTPSLRSIFSQLDVQTKKHLEIVFISSDADHSSFDEYFLEMPWKALPFADRDRSTSLAEKFQVAGIPSLIVLSPEGELISSLGVEEVKVGCDKALQHWSQGKSLFWSRPARVDEFVWNELTCEECFLHPLLGRRFVCLTEGCRSNLCEECSGRHSHHLRESFLPTGRYSCETLLQSVCFLLQPKTEEKLSPSQLCRSPHKAIGFYFSAHWSPACQAFTPRFVELYEQLNDKGLEILFISADRDEQSFDHYRNEMPWPASPRQSTQILKEYFRFPGVPSLFVVSLSGEFLTRHGQENIARHGLQALKHWAQGEPIPRPPAEQYEWRYVACDRCQLTPLIGQRYSCSICPNFDLCSKCHREDEDEHPHPFLLQEQPEDY